MCKLLCRRCRPLQSQLAIFRLEDHLSHQICKYHHYWPIACCRAELHEYYEWNNKRITVSYPLLPSFEQKLPQRCRPHVIHTCNYDANDSV